VAAMLGTLDHRHVLALVEALADIDAPRLLAEIAQLAEQGPDFAAVLDDMTAVLHRLAVAQMVPDAVDNAHGDRETILALASRFTAEDVQLYYQIGIQGRGDMTHAPDLRTALEMTLLRMLAFRPQGVPQPARTPLPLCGAGGDGTPAAPAGGEGTPPAAASRDDNPASTDSSQPPEPEPPSGPAPVASAPQARVEADALPEPPPPWEELPVEMAAPLGEASPAPAEPQLQAQTQPEPQPEAAPPSMEERFPQPPADEPAPAPHDAPLHGHAPRHAPIQEMAVATEESDTAVLEAPERPSDAPAVKPEAQAATAEAASGERFSHDRWLDSFDALGLGGLTRNLAAHCVVEADDGNRLTLRLDPSQEAMNAEIHVRRVQEALAGIGIARQLVIEPGALPTQVETPRQRADRIAAERHAEAVAALHRDPHVKQLQETFGARLIESTVKPADLAPRA
ncbi:MAG: DNA polymerase III subunit gamma/tau, partial [Halomonas sp.]|nr:DNA polymerase III subunit gamma/tau [Halomonas sp.]